MPELGTSGSVGAPGAQASGATRLQTDVLSVFGAALLRQHEGGVAQMPAGVGQVAFTAAAGEVTATLAGSSLKLAEHSVAVLLIDASSGRPVFVDYGIATKRTAAADGTVESVTAQAPGFSGEARAYLMVDTYPAARQTVTVP